MSNRNFDSRVITQRLQNQTFARNLYDNNVRGKRLINNQQSSNGTVSQYTNFTPGAQTEYFRGLLGGGGTTSIGGIVNIPPYITSTVSSISTPQPILYGSMVFDYNFGENGSHVSFINDGSLTIGTQPFTIEWYQYLQEGASYPRVFSIGSYNEEHIPIAISYESSIYLWINGNANQIADVNPPINEWSHMAIVGNGNTITVYLNGRPIGTVEGGYDISDTETSLMIGNETVPSSEANFTGLITNFRWVVGSQIYTTYFTPPSVPLSNVTGTKLLLLAPNNNIIGSSSSNRQATNTGIVFSEQLPSVPFVVPPAVPSIPIITSAISQNTQVTVIFTQEYDGGSPIINYQYSIDGGDTFIDLSSNIIPTTSLTITGLTNGTPYNIQIKAINTVGASNPSLTYTVTPLAETEGLLLFLDGASGPSVKGVIWHDTSGLNNDCSLTNLPTWSDSNLGYYNFDGTQYGQVPPGFNDFTQGLTILTFVNPGNTNTWERIIDFGNGPRSDNILFNRQGITSNLAFEIYNGIDQLPTFTAIKNNGLINNKWGFYVTRLDGSNNLLKNQNNADLIVTSYLPSNVVRNNNYIGKSNWVNDSLFGGDIGIIAIYNKALTDSEIDSFYDSFKERYFTVPDAPTEVSAIAGNAQAEISFTAPTNTGGINITSYTVTSSPGGITATGTSSPITITGLTNGTSYTFTVIATNDIGNSVGSSASSPVTPYQLPAYVSGTQLLVNPEFTEIVNNGANGWTSSTGWSAHDFYNANKPTAVLDLPKREGIYPESSSSGFVIFSYISATISQTVPITNLVGINTITCVLNIINILNNNAIDNFTFQIQYKNSSGAVLYTSTTNNVQSQAQAPATWTDYTLTLTRDATTPQFDKIKSITVSIISKDNGFWNGHYGPAMDYCRLTIS